MHLNDAGQMIRFEWQQLVERLENIRLHEFVIMPNHFHAILEIVVHGVGPTLVVGQTDDDDDDIDGEGQGQPQGFAPAEIAPTGIAPIEIEREQIDEVENPEKAKKTIGDMIGAFKSITTVKYIRGVKNNGWTEFDGRLWQRNYWEHIIRNEEAYSRISEYIKKNPSKWDEDKLND